jgi:serine/threonine protein kinase
MALAPGTHVGPYEITGIIGAGGMGEVYRARDPRLRRDVAIKVLSSAAPYDVDRLGRFEQEACAAAALNHPNILTVHEIGSGEGSPYVVSELLDGETLRAKLEHGPLPLRIAIEYAMQMLNGLAAAHQKGIIHRDLKPDNLFVTTDDRVKILDFGLAKLVQPDMTGQSAAALPTRPPETTPGMILGTIGYMSPEQVRGQQVDQRSDLFNVGAILHEMVSGEQPFKGGSAADVMSAILHAEPTDLSTTGRVPPALDRIIRHCLVKDAAQRFQSARDVAFALEGLSDTSAAAVATRSRPVPSRKPVVAAAALALLIAAAWLSFSFFRSRQSPVPVVENVARVTHEPGFSEWPTWSPDGRMFAFSSNKNGNFDIYLARAGAGQEVVNVTRDSSDSVQPAFSPDGASIAFVSTRSSRRPLTKIGTYAGQGFRSYGGDIWVTPVLGGQPRRLAPDGNFPAWHPDGRSIAYVSGDESQRSILSVSADGGSPRPLLAPDASNWEIVRLAYVPGGRWISFETGEGLIFLMPAGGGTPKQLLRGRAHTWAASGRRLYYLHVGGTASKIEAADVTEASDGLTISTVAIVGTNTAPIQQLAMAPDGGTLLVADIQESLSLTRLALTPAGDDVVAQEETLDSGQVRNRYPTVSPNGGRILFGSNRFGLQDLWTIDVVTGQRHRVELPRVPYEGATGCWLSDSQVVVMTVEKGANTFWRVALDGSETEQLVPPGEGGPAVSTGSFACAVSPDGKTFLYHRLVGNFTQIKLLDVASRRERMLTSSPSQKYDATWSPDGRWIAFATNSDGGINVWRIAAAGGEERPLTNGVDRIRHFFYSPDGRWLYIQPNHRNIYRMPADGGARHPVTRFRESSGLYIEEPTISPDGRYLVYVRDNGGSSLWLFTLKGRW